jgi:hypothetical protein
LVPVIFSINSPDVGSGSLRHERCTEGKMEIMKIGGILLLIALGLWIIKSLFDWWEKRRASNKWLSQHKANVTAWERREEISKDRSEDRGG